MTVEPITLSCADGYPLSAKIFRTEAVMGMVVIAPALGVPQRFYAPFATYLSERGFTTLTFDYRGSGESVTGDLRGRDMRMEDWGHLDIDAALIAAQSKHPPGKLFLIGHSAGAQLPGLAAASQRLDGLVLVAGSAPHLRHYPLRAWPLLLVTWYGLGPVLSVGRDDFPTRLTGLGSTRVAAGVVRQWARWARTRDYMFDPAHQINTRNYAQLRLPLLSYCIADDSYATPDAVNALLAHYPAAQVERRIVPKPARGTIGHFGFFRAQQKDTLWRETADWLEKLR